MKYCTVFLVWVSSQWISCLPLPAENPPIFSQCYLLQLAQPPDPTSISLWGNPGLGSYLWFFRATSGCGPMAAAALQEQSVVYSRLLFSRKANHQSSSLPCVPLPSLALMRTQSTSNESWKFLKESTFWSENILLSFSFQPSLSWYVVDYLLRETSSPLGDEKLQCSYMPSSCCRMNDLVQNESFMQMCHNWRYSMRSGNFHWIGFTHDAVILTS